jgi:hypothetical protein
VVLAATACGAAALQSDLTRPAPPAAQAVCRPADLHALFRGFQAGGASSTGAVVIVNAGASRCWLQGGPQSVTLVDSGGAQLAVKSRSAATPIDGGSVELLPGAALPTFGAPPAPGSAWFAVTWTNWCSDAIPDVGSLVLVLPSGGTVAAPADPQAPTWEASPAVPRCDDTRAGSLLTAGRFQAPHR